MVYQRVLPALCLISLRMFAQETINFASIGGRVTDPTGAVVEGATVAVRHVETNIANNTKTDSEGRFRFPYMKPGPYEIKIEHAGFSNSTQSLTLTIGGRLRFSGNAGAGLRGGERNRK